MGLVYRAYHPHLERTGAVKVMQAIAPDRDAIARFRHEAQAIAQMRHLNILNVYDFGEFEGTPYMIVEFVAGGSLADRLSQDLLDETVALKYLRGIAAGLDYAHSMGVVHRDVKPANVLLTSDDTPVLADFGLAKLLQGSSLKSMTGVTTGTPAYMAPEQVMGSQVGPAADRYALATIAYEMLAGTIPFQGEALLELLYAQVHRYPQPPSARRPSLGPYVDNVIMRGLSKDPADRWESCAKFVDALQVVVADRRPAPLATTLVMRPETAPPLPPAPISAPQIAPVYASPPALPSTSVPVLLPPPSAPPAYAGPPVPAQSRGATVAVAYPAPPPATKTRRRSRRGLITMVAGLVILVLAVVAFLAYEVAHQTPMLSLSSTTVAPGDTVVVNASRLPASQSGELELYSQVYVFPFQADSSGQATVHVTIPLDVAGGDHVMKVCWSGTCHGQVALHVVVVVVTPTPYSFPSPSPSPTYSPFGTPTPTVFRTPTPGVPSLALSSGSVRRDASFTVYGQHFPPSRSATVNFIQGSVVGAAHSASVTSLGTFLVTINVPTAAVPGPAEVRACAGSVCAYATLTVLA
jgi:serine/threonine protein kinase